VSAASVTPEPLNPALASANRRIVARWVDALILGFVGGIALVFLWTIVVGPIASELADNQVFNTMLAFFGMMLLDAPCTKLWGRTPGKVLLRLRVVSADGSPISWSRAWERALLVWAQGLWVGIPLLFLIASAVAMRRVVRTGRASWDEATRTNVVRLRSATDSPAPVRHMPGDLRTLLTDRNYLLLLATLAVIGAAYYFLASPLTTSHTTNLCPATLRGEPSLSESGLQWGGNTSSPKVTASIVRVAVECIPVNTPATTENNVKVPASTSYQLAATATIDYKVLDPQWLERSTAYTDLQANVVFEAVSASGVVLASQEGQFKVVGGRSSSTGHSSSTLTITEPIIERVATLRARWAYGHY